MWPLDARAQNVLRTSHSVTARVTAYPPGNQAGVELPITGGTVDFDAKSQVRRTASLTIADPALWPAFPLDALSPVGSELAVEYGVMVPGIAEPFWVPLIRGPVQQVSGTVADPATLAVTVNDRAKTVMDNRPEAPFQTNPAQTCVQVITGLIAGSVDTTITDLTASTQLCPKLDIDRDIWAEGIEKIADSFGAEVYCERDGGFVIRPQPRIEDYPVWDVDAGDTGVLIEAKRALARAQVYNAVIARGERTDNTPPVWAMVTDDDPASPTRWGGEFGKRPRFYTSPLLVTEPQCEAAATALLARVNGYVASIEVSTIVHPALDPGDVIVVILPDGEKQRHIIDKLTVPLGANASLALTTRTTSELPAER